MRLNFSTIRLAFNLVSQDSIMAFVALASCCHKVQSDMKNFFPDFPL